MSSNNKTISKNVNKSSGNSVLKIIGTVIVGLAVVGLVFSSVYSGSSGNRNQMVFGSYGDKNIQFFSDNEFGQAVEQEMGQYNLSGIESDNPFYEIVRLRAWRSAYESIVLNKAIAFHVENSGYEVSSRAVDRMVIDYGPWRTNNIFDEVLYRNASESRKESVRTQFKQQAGIEVWAADTLQSKHRSASELAFLDNMRRSVRTYQMVSIPFSDFPEEEVIAYANKNSELFASLPVSRIAVESEEKANEIIALINDSSTSFADLAVEHSQDAYATDGGDMGDVSKYRLAELIGNENAESVFAASSGDIIGPMNTDYNWMIFSVDGPKTAADLTEGLEDVRTYMLQNEVGIIEENLLTQAEKLRVQSISGAVFADAAADSGYSVLTTGAFPVNFGGDSLLGSNPENAGLAELAGSVESDAFWKEIVPLAKVGQVSRPVVLSNSVALFSLETETELDAIDYWELLVDTDTSRGSEQDYRTAILAEDNEYHKDNFSETYTDLFRNEG